MKITITIFLLSVLLLLPQCSSMRVETDYDSQYNFSQLKSFHFVQPRQGRRGAGGHLIRSPQFIRAAQREIESVLINKGFRKARNQRRADFLVAFYATARNRATFTPASYRVGRYGRRYVRPGRVYRYKQGTLIIDIIDASHKEMIWRGVGTGILDPYRPVRDLFNAVRKVLRTFPPQ